MNEKSGVEITSAKGVLAGILIGIGGVSFLSAEPKALGSFLFAVGLLTVILQKYSLFTGKIGYLSGKSDVLPLALMLLRNIVGAVIVGLLTFGAARENAVGLVAAKLSKPLTEVFVASVFCGVLIYIAVELFSKEKHPLLVIMPIMAFILCGFEHCIADAFYFAAARTVNADVIVFMLVCILGNALGSIAVRFAEKFRV